MKLEHSSNNIRIHSYDCSDFKSLDTSSISDLLLKGHVVVIAAETSRIDVNKISKRYLTNSEKNRMNQYVKMSDKSNHLISYSIVNLLFMKILKCGIETIQHKKLNNGKPYVENDKNVEYNISHSQNGIAVAFSINQIGIDLEAADMNFPFQEIVRYSFSNWETDLIKDDASVFFKIRVAKEAYLKYEGVGLLKNITWVRVKECGEDVLVIQDQECNTRKEIKIFTLFNHYVMGICC